MSDEVQEAQELLRSVEKSLPWRFDEVTQPEKWQGTTVRFGAVRSKDSRNIIQPFEGSSSIMMGLPEMIDFIIKAPNLLQTMSDVMAEKDAEIMQLKAENKVLERLLHPEKD